MAGKRDIEVKLHQAKEGRETFNDTALVLSENMPDITDEMVRNYIADVKWLETNAKKVLESNDPSMVQLKKKVGDEIVYAGNLDRLYNQKLTPGKINYDDFKTELKMLNSALRDGGLDGIRSGGGGTSPSPAGGPTTPGGGQTGKTFPQPVKPSATGPPSQPQRGGQATPMTEEEEMAEAIRQVEEAMEKEKRGEELKRRETSSAPEGDRARRDREEKERRDREKKERDDRERRDKEERDRRDKDKWEKEERDRKDREDRDRKDRERRDREDKERRDREKRDQEEKDRKAREDSRNRESPSIGNSGVITDPRKSQNQQRKLDDYSDDYEEVKPNKPTGKNGQSPGSNRGKAENEFRKGVDKLKDNINRDNMGRLIGAATPGMLATDDVARTIGSGADGVIGERYASDALRGGVDGILAERDAGDLIGRTKDSMLAQDGAGRLLGNTMGSMLNQDAMGRMIGSATPGLLNQDSFGRLVGNSVGGMLNQDAFGRMIGAGMPSMFNQDAFGKLLGSGMPSMLNQDGFAKMLGTAIDNGMTSAEAEVALAQKQKAELEIEIKNKETALHQVRNLVSAEELKEQQLKDKLHGLRSLAADIKAETEKVRQQADEKKEETVGIKREVKSLKHEIHSIEKEIDVFKKSEQTRLNAHKELRQERQAHKKALQEMEIEIQTYKTGYSSLMRRWEEDLNGVPNQADLPNNIGHDTFKSSFLHHQPLPTAHNSFATGEPDRYSISSSTAYQPGRGSMITRQPLEATYGGSSYASRYLRQFN